MAKFEDIKEKVASYCGIHTQYRFDVDEGRKAILVEGEGKTISLSIEKGRVECSDPAFQQALLDFEDESGGFLPVPIMKDEGSNIKALVADIPNLGMLSAEGIRNFINPKATGQEIIDHLLIANALGLNVLTKEIYLVKRKDGTISHITGLNAFTRRAAQNKDVSHYKSGVIVTKKGEDDPIFRPGTFYLPGETLVGGWCTVYFRDGREPIEATVALAEYHTGVSVWAQKPATMIEKVAKVKALRMACPIETNNLYIAEEMGIDPGKEVRAEAEVVD